MSKDNYLMFLYCLAVAVGFILGFFVMAAYASYKLRYVCKIWF